MWLQPVLFGQRKGFPRGARRTQDPCGDHYRASVIDEPFLFPAGQAQPEPGISCPDVLPFGNTTRFLPSIGAYDMQRNFGSRSMGRVRFRLLHRG